MCFKVPNSLKTSLYFYLISIVVLHRSKQPPCIFAGVRLASVIPSPEPHSSGSRLALGLPFFFELFFCELAGFAVVLVSWIFYLLTSTSNSCMARIFDEIVLELIDS